MHKFPSDEEIKKLFKDVKPSAGGPPMPRPEEIDLDFHPLLEFESALRLAKELAMSDEQKILEGYIQDRIKRMTKMILEKPKPINS